MKKIIDGVICDTENAKFITGHIFPGECWELYQTQTGEYFRYIEKENKPDEKLDEKLDEKHNQKE